MITGKQVDGAPLLSTDTHKWTEMFLTPKEWGRIFRPA